MKYKLFAASVAALLISVCVSARAEEEQDVFLLSRYVADRQWEQALALGQVLVSRDSIDDSAWYYLGESLMAHDRKPEAEAAYRQAIQLDTANHFYLEALMDCYIEMRDGQKRDSLCEVMISRFPKKFHTPYYLTVMGDKSLYSGKTAEARKYFDSALALDDTYPAALYGNAEASRVSGNAPGFFFYAGRFMGSPMVAPDFKSEYMEGLFKEITPALYRGWKDQFDSLVDTIVAVHPTDSSVLLTAGRWYYSTERQEKAYEYFDRWYDAWPNSFAPHSFRLSQYVTEEKWAEAIKECDIILEKVELDKSQYVSINSTKADCLYKLGYKRKAFRTYERLLRILPDDRVVLNNYAYFLCSEKGKLKKAERLSARSLELNGEEASSLDTYGWILYLRGRYDEAQKYFKKALVFGGMEHEEILEHYSILLEAMGDTQKAAYYRAKIGNLKTGKK